MMKIATKRRARSGSGKSSGVSSAVLEAPEETYAPNDEAVAAWQGRGPAPAGALQRGYAGEPSADGYAGVGVSAIDDEYVPQRGAMRLKFRNLQRSVGGRVVLGVSVFVALGFVALVVAVLRASVMHDGRFVVTSSSEIQISGNAHLTRAQVVSVFGADLERNIFKVPLEERRADLERLPWVSHATVMRLLPDKIRVQITERVPVAFVRQGSQIGLVDATGVLLDMPPQDAGDPNYSFPVLTGLVATDPPQARAARMEVYRAFMLALDGGGEKLSQTISEVDVANPEDVKALVTTGGTDVLVHFGDEEFLKRYKEFRQHLPEWKAQYPKLASADMRYEGQIVLEMQRGTEVPLAGDAAVAKGADAGAASEPKATAAKAASPAAPKAKAGGAKVVRASAKGKAKPGTSKANQKVFAALAAARKKTAGAGGGMNP
jgi:cell division protein FtsQ